jgi:hypothetical protein
MVQIVRSKLTDLIGLVLENVPICGDITGNTTTNYRGDRGDRQSQLRR